MPKVKTILSLSASHPKKNPYDVLCHIFCTRYVRDRFNVLNKYSSIDWVDTVDKVPEPINIPIGELMDQRASELIKKGSITVQWSGGVDSTSLLLALIKNRISKEDLKICLDGNSISEYPKLYEHLKKQKYNLCEVTNWHKELANTDTKIITNGWCADQLFGSVFFHSAPNFYNYSIPDFLLQGNLACGSLTKEEANEYSEIYKDWADKVFGIKLETAAQLGWLTNFCMKWTWVSKFNYLWLLGTRNQRKTEVFYDTPYFQAWALGNYENIAKANIYSVDARYYKQPLKAYCNSIFPDEEYLLNKTKKPSWNAREDQEADRNFKIIIETTSGFSVHSFAGSLPIGRYQEIINRIFTEISK